MANTVRKIVWRMHKWLSYLVFLQIFLWVVGGLFFATVPFSALVKGGDFVAPPAAAELPDDWQMLVPAQPGLRTVTAVASAQGVLLKLERADGEQWLLANGQPATRASAAQVADFARRLYTGPVSEPDINWLSATESRWLGLVDETGGRTGLWQADFDGVRLYFGPKGDYGWVRSDYWVWYDALWRLHIMDYGTGKDFNNSLLRVFAWLAFVFVLTGLAMSFFALQRSLRR